MHVQSATHRSRQRTQLWVRVYVRLQPLNGDLAQTDCGPCCPFITWWCGQACHHPTAHRATIQTQRWYGVLSCGPISITVTPQSIGHDLPLSTQHRGSIQCVFIAGSGISRRVYSLRPTALSFPRRSWMKMSPTLWGDSSNLSWGIVPWLFGVVIRSQRERNPDLRAFNACGFLTGVSETHTLADHTDERQPMRCQYATTPPHSSLGLVQRTTPLGSASYKH